MPDPRGPDTVITAATVLGDARDGGPGVVVFLLTGLGIFLVSLDVSVANAVLPAIGRSFHNPPRAELSWIITVYAITFAAVLVPAGRLADRAGRRRVFAMGLILFATGSAMCGAAPTMSLLLVGRVIQAVGAATLQPASLGLLVAAISVRARATYVARWGGMGAVGIGLGPSLGGFITSASTWRWVFLINLPVIAVALLATPRYLRETARHRGRRLPDPFGAVLLALAAGALTLGISEGGAWGWLNLRTVSAIGGGILLAAAFVRRCTVVADPVLDLDLLRNRQFALVTLVTVLYAAAFFGTLFTFMLFLTGPWHMTLTAAGLALTPMPVAALLLTTCVGAISDRTGFRLPMTVGTACMTVGLLLSAAVDRGTSFSVSWLPIVAFLGFGVGLCFPLLSAAAVAAQPPTRLAAATAVNQCARQIGAALGVAGSVAALGTGVNADVSGFHTAWLLCGASTAVAAVAALGITRNDVAPATLEDGRR